MVHINTERLDAYLLKAAREQKSWTTWTEQDKSAENEMLGYAHAICENAHVRQSLTDFWAKIFPAVRANILGMCALHFTIVGVPDLYQGEEITQNSLVDPDNRRPIDFHALHETLRDLDERGLPNSPDLDDEKLWLTSRLTRLRAQYPQMASALVGYQPLPVSTGHAIAFSRTIDDKPFLITVAMRSIGLMDNAEHNVVLPEGDWTNILTEETVSGGTQLLSDITGRFPVGVFVRKDS